MNPLDDLPQPWRTAMENAGLYSLRDVSARTGLGTTTVSDLIYGRKASSERTMQAVADCLRVPVTQVREWALVSRGQEQPFVLPAEANRLTRRQRDAVLTMVRAMLDPGSDTEVPQPDLSRVEGLRLGEFPTLQPVDDPEDRGS